MHVGRSSEKAPWIMPDQPVVDGDRRPGVARLPTDLVDDRAGLLARSPCDAARIARGPTELAGDVAERRIGADAVDLKSLDVVDRPAPSAGRTGSPRSRGRRCPRPSCRAPRRPPAPSAATRSPGPPQCAEVKPIRLPRLSLPIAVECAEGRRLDHDARTTAQRDRPIGVRRRCGASNSAARATIDAQIVRQRTPGPQVSNPHRRAARPSNRASLSSAGIVSVDATWQHERD